MGTRSLTHFHQAGLNSPVLCTMYRQFDGYPTGHGADIKAALGGKTLVNGYSDAATQVNGLADAATQLIAYCKTNGGKDPIGAGGVYMMLPGEGSEEFNYHVFATGGDLHVSVAHGDDALWTGPVSAFDGEAIENAQPG